MAATAARAQQQHEQQHQQQQLSGIASKLLYSAQKFNETWIISSTVAEAHITKFHFVAVGQGAAVKTHMLIMT